MLLYAKHVIIKLCVAIIWKHIQHHHSFSTCFGNEMYSSTLSGSGGFQKCHLVHPYPSPCYLRIWHSALPGEKIKWGGRCHRGSGTGFGWARRGNSIAVDVDTEILAGKNDGAVIGKRHIKALRMLHATLEGRHKAPVRRKQSRIEVVVVVGDQNAAHRVNADTNRIVCDAFTTNLT